MTAQDPDEDARRLSGEALIKGDATGWFERLYAEAADGQAIVPWDRRAPDRYLVDWIEQQPCQGAGHWWLVRDLEIAPHTSRHRAFA